MIELQLRQEDAKLIYLAVAYHLGRPGSELDPITKQQVEHGLAEVASELQPQLVLAMAQISLNDDQITRLASAMFGSITELKAYPLLELGSDPNSRKSSVPGFDRTLRHLYPEVDADVEVTADLAELMIMLKRRLDAQFTQAPAAPAIPEEAPKRRWWPFKR
jgi:hypothetical protein